MKKDQKYYGEVWFEDHKDQKHFCIMSFEDDNLVLETNLHATNQVYKEPQILGIFNGLGYLTFIDCRIQSSSTGIVETRIYKPKYSFRSDSHFINVKSLKINKFSIVNDAIVKWINHATWYDDKKNKLIKKDFVDNYSMEQIGLKISIQHYLSYGLKKRSELFISNRGSVNFELQEPQSLLKAIELYDRFQTVLQTTFGSSSKFRSFSFKCMGCNTWKELYYNDKKLSASSHSFVHTKYEEVKGSLLPIFSAAYCNRDFQFCLDKLMENFVGKHPSHNKRFTNSIAAYEAFCKLFLENPENTKLSQRIITHQEIFGKIGAMGKEEWEKFPSKVVRSRDFHIHSNTGNRDIFSEFDLLYISFLFDFVIAYLLLSQLDGVQENLLNKYIQHGNRVFVDMKRTNAILGTDPFD